MLQQLSVFIENKKGRLSNVTSVLKDYKIDIRAIAVFDTPEFGILRLVVDQPDLAKSVLNKDGYIVRKSSVIGIDLEDSPGKLNDILLTLNEADLSVNYIYSFVLQKAGKPLIVFNLDDNERGKKVLKEAGIKVVNGSDIQQ